MSSTRILWHQDGGERDVRNERTAILDLPRMAPRLDLEAIFLRHYEQIAERCLRWDRPGLAVAALDEEGVVAAGRIAAKEEESNAAILGRHGKADIFLPDDPSISLRHLALLIPPWRSETAGRFRLLDLRSGTAFADERGLRLEALEAAGPVFLHCGHYRIFLFPTGGYHVWPDDAEEAWESIPERVYLKEEPARAVRKPLLHVDHPDRPVRERSAAEAEDAEEPSGPRELTDPASSSMRVSTLVHTSPGPSPVRRQLVPGDEALGELSVRSRTSRSVIALGPRALHQGVLLGRYARCDSDGLVELAQRAISRVHLLIIGLDGRVCAVDAASTNGVRHGGRTMRAMTLYDGCELKLGEVVKLTWRVAH